MSIPEFDSVGDATAATNAEAFGSAAAHVALQSAQAYGAHMARLNMVSESAIAAFSNNMVTPDPMETMSTLKLFSRESSQISEAMALAKMLVGEPKE